MAANAPSTPTLNLTTEKTPTESVIRCAGRVTLPGAARLWDTAKGLFRESRLVVLDFSGVDHVDSAGLGMVPGLWISASNSGCTLRLVNMSPRVRAIFAIARVDQLLGL